MITRLKIEKLSKRFKEKQILTNISFYLDNNEIVGLFGRNGSGKSTLFKILFGLLKPDSINAKINGDVFNPKNNHKTQMIGMLPQDNFLPNDIKIRRLIPKIFPKESNQDEILYDPRIAKIENQRVGTLSYGERRYLEILIISCLPQRFLLLDEPFSMIEPLFQDAIKKLIVSKKTEKGIILTDHYFFDTLQITDRNLLLKDENLIKINNKEDLIEYGYLSR